MVKQKLIAITEEIASKGFCERSSATTKITAPPSFLTRPERLSPFEGVLPSIKFLSLPKFEKERYADRVFCLSRHGKAHKKDGVQITLGRWSICRMP
jgi:hypothetical protein